MLLGAAALDWWMGDPEWLPHPVRLIGSTITTAERVLYRPTDTRARQFVAGAVTTTAVVGLTFGSTWLLLRCMHRVHPALGTAAEVWLGASCLASRNLYDEASAVLDALEAGDLPRARQRLARIVGRDTHELTEPEISRAVIETVAESTCDGIVAPLFFLTLGGVPLAMAFKAVSTLDSMIGHTTERYLWFGKCAARLDDAANFLPARVAALGIVVASGLLREASAAAAARTWIADGSRHRSPNAGQPEAAMAGALQVRLGGTNTYGGEVVQTPELGADFARASRVDARAATRLMVLTSAMTTIAALLLVRGRRGRRR